MSNGLNINDPTVVAAFRAALLHQGIVALVIFAVLSVAWVSVREWRSAGGTSGEAAAAGRTTPTVAPEPGWRQVLRIGFGLLWLFDGILQAQPGMAVGLPSQIIEPGATSSPHWVQSVVNWAGTAWSYHPVEAGAAAVWIQVGIGLLLLFAPRGALSRLAGVASIAWGLVVWVFGEAFGEILAPGLSWLTGAPGAAAFYVAAGVLIALPGTTWRSPRLGRVLAGATGVFLLGMALLQAWPGRGFWQGSLRGQPGSLTSMVQDMSTTSQPSALSHLVADFGSFVRDHGFAVNLFAVIALAVLGAAFCAAALARTRARTLARGATAGLAVLCLATWLLVQDLGFFGGLGTDPNSMIPVALLGVAAFLALTRPAPALGPADEPVPADVAMAASADLPAVRRAGWRAALSPATYRPAALSRAFAETSLWTVLAASAIGVIFLGAVPMAAAQATPNAAPILAEAIDGSSAPLHAAASDFTLTDQNGRQVSLSSLHGKAVLLTFLDPVCVTQCPLEAQEFRQAGQLLGAQARNVELVAVNLNPLYSDVGYTRAFDRAERLTGVRNWLFLTGTPEQLRPVWRDYGQVAQTLPAGSMLGHSDSAFVIGPSGQMTQELNFDPGPGTAATQSSFATELADAARHALHES